MKKSHEEKLVEVVKDILVGCDIGGEADFAAVMLIAKIRNSGFKISRVRGPNKEKE